MRADPESPRQELVDLLLSQSVAVGSFTLASGRTSSYYIDARKTTMSARGLQLIGAVGLSAIRDAGWAADAVGGLTLGADPVAYALSRASLDQPPVVNAFTVRKEAKTHGARRRIEGCFDSGQAVVVVEDVITTGQSAIQAIEAVRAAGGRITGVLALVDRDEGGRAAIERTGIPVCTLISLRDLHLPPDDPQA